MTIFGLDISHHQDAALDLARCAREGIDFVFIKATEGASWRDPAFAGNVAEARAAGLLVAAYHYQRPDTVALQVANIRAVVPADVPVILDVEAGSGSVDITRELVDGLRAAGYRVPLTYLPRWYWQQLHSPSLTGLPPLWSSRYPDTVVGSIADEWADVPASYWDGYGGLPVEVLQFTSSAALAGFHPIDANAYRGTRAQLAAQLGGNTQGQEIDDMGWNDPIPVNGTLVAAGTVLAYADIYAGQAATDSAACKAMLVTLMAKQADALTEQTVLDHLDAGLAAQVDRLRADAEAARQADRDLLIAAVRDAVPAEIADGVVNKLAERLQASTPASSAAPAQGA